MSDIICTDRSRIEIWEKCPRKRFWSHEYQGGGIDRSRDLKIDARIGSGVHDGIEWGLNNRIPSLVAKEAGGAFVRECNDIVGDVVRMSQLEHDIIEGAQLVEAIAYAWLRVIAPRLLVEGDILAIEKEMSCDFPVPTPAGSTIVRLMTRPDIIWRRRSDGTIFIRNLKTVRRADDRFREKWSIDQQTLSEPLAVDKWLRNDDEWLKKVDGIVSPDICGGVIIDGLVTGEVVFDRYRGLFYHNNPLIYCWRSGEDIKGAREFYPRYEWTCTEPHKFSNGRRCEGGHTHKLSGVTKVSVADHYPGGIIAWIDHLIANHPDVIGECIVELPPVIRSEYQIERWKRQVLHREIDIKRWAAQCNETAPEVFDVRLDAAFPMSTSNGNCIFPSKCAYFDCCHGASGSDPLNAGYQVRVPNHPGEYQ